MERLPTIDSKTLAFYILNKYGKMSHLKLQKLIYFVEGYHLAYFQGASLIDDDFEAWAHGPVSKTLYNTLKNLAILYGDITSDDMLHEISSVEDIESKLYSAQKEIIDEVLEMYIKEDGITLEGITHQQTPWIIARGNLPPYAKCNNRIDKNLMKDYFSKLLN